MSRIKITCEHCNRTFEVNRTSDIPDDVESLGCNWCPACESEAEEYWDEWYNYS